MRMSISMSAGAAHGGRLAGRLQRLCEAFFTSRSRSLSTTYLQTLSDRQLRDIGLTRQEIERTTWDYRGERPGSSSRKDRMH